MSSSVPPPAAAVAGDETAPLSMMRTVSSEGAAFAHPTPDLQTAKGAYIGNIERLEDHAERMSIAGSDIQEEIRKLQLEQALSDSRRSSLHFASQSDEPARTTSQRSRKTPYISRANSVVDVNQAARWGGYSPNAFISSPVGSITSSSWAQPFSLPLRSTSKHSVLDTLPEPPVTDSAHRPSFEALPPHIDPETASQTSFAAELKAIAQDIQEQLDGTEPTNADVPSLDPPLDISDELRSSPATPDIPDRPPSAGSTNTFQQAQHLFTDFDGVHYAPSMRDPSGGSRVSTLDSSGTRRASGLPLRPQRDTWAQPPPDPNMVYYPAPVPMMLNLPQKISKRPAAAVQAKRRDQMLSMMAPQDRSAAPWIEKGANDSSTSLDASVDGKANKSKSMAGLPPQLRATMFFDAQPVHHEVEVKAGSAGITLDSILEASASAPVGAFTDHPFAGQQGAKVYRRETAAPRRSTTSMMAGSDYGKHKSLISLAGNSADQLEKTPIELKKRRSSFTMLFGKRSHSTNELVGTDAARSTQGSRFTMRSTSGGATVNGDIYHGDATQEGEEAERASEDEPLRRRQSGLLQDDDPEADAIDGDFHDAMSEQEGEEEDDEDLYAPPTTLLAELQKRKAQQKSRNRTAATAFPNGMHSTLLELDAVEEMERKKKVKQRIALAWEDPDIKAQIEAEQDDDDVPLGMLYQKQDGAMRRISRANLEATAALAEADWDRPLGLIEQRELENNEPLSSRRNRLKGLAPQVMTKRNTGMHALQSQHSLPRASQLNLAVQVDSSGTSPNGASPITGHDGGSDDDDVPLAQRARQLKTRNALSMAISDIEGSKRISDAFAGDLLSQFGANEKAANGEDSTPITPVIRTPDPDETLAQRRARLQAEREAKTQRPPISRHTSAGSGDLLNNARASTILPGTTPSPDPAAERPKSGLGLNGLRASRSMADLLAAHPLTANANSARKMSDDQLTKQLPAGSLLAQNDVLQRRNKQRLSSYNNPSASQGGMEGPLLSQVDERKRRMSSGNFGALLANNNGNGSGGQPTGTFDRGLLGSQEQRQTGALLSRQQPAMQHQQQAPVGMMSAYGMPGMPSYPSMPSMQPYGNSMAPMSMSMYNLPQMPMMQMQQPYGMMGMQMPNMSTPNFGAMSQPMMMHHQQQQQYQQQPQPQTYAAFAQQQMGMATGLRGGMGMDDTAALSPEQRDMVHRWRQGIS